MLTAFDTLLQTAVTAEKAAINGDNEAFRYECLCCGEEVFLAAQDSIYKATHFRHKSGNNDKDCELYLGQYGILPSSYSQRNKQERVEFYYDNNTKCFSISFNFSEEEISEYEKAGAILEIRERRNSLPFFNTKIDHLVFSDGKPEKFILDKKAEPYYISNTFNNKKREYYVFSYDSPSFFKILNSDPSDENFSAKLIRSKSIYTGVRYFISWPGRNTAQLKLKNIPDVCVEKETQFTALGWTTVWGMVVSFKDKNPLLDSILSEWGYNLGVSESVSLLWPPAYEKDEKLFVTSSKLYLHSTFKFQGLGNINTTDKYISKVSDSITMVSMHDSIHILKKNAELEVYNDLLTAEIQLLRTSVEETDEFCVPKGNSFFLFSELGAYKLREGQTIFLTPSTFICEYAGNTLIRLIKLSCPVESDIETKFYEIMSNYWITKEYQKTITGIFPQSINDYLERCKNTGRINVAIEQLIKGDMK